MMNNSTVSVCLKLLFYALSVLNDEQSDSLTYCQKVYNHIKVIHEWMNDNI